MIEGNPNELEKERPATAAADDFTKFLLLTELLLLLFIKVDLDIMKLSFILLKVSHGFING